MDSETGSTTRWLDDPLNLLLTSLTGVGLAVAAAIVSAWLSM